MKRLLLTVILLVGTSISLAFTTIKRSQEEYLNLASYKELVIAEISIAAPELSIDTKNHSKFLKDIGFRESTNRYEVVNRLGYMGKYQFHSKTLKALGYDVSKKEFLNDPSLQEEAMHKLLQSNKKTLQKYIDKYDGKTVHGIYITESGILAAAHLGGAGNVSKWFRRGINFKDANGTKITNYMQIFSGYTLDLYGR